jgi:hypothetical protein
MNSVDKDTDGDYLVSSRYTNAVYKVSGSDGSLIWQLGGRNSSFIQDGFDISHQHNARFVQENETTTIISLFNNRLNSTSASANYSSGMLIALYTAEVPKVAKLIGHWDAPDHSLTHQGGSIQILPDSNVFINWVTQGSISEFAATGECLLEARFVSEGLRSYRAYKFNFEAAPAEPPALTAFITGGKSTWSTTIFYVSWNGATEVTHWNFYEVEPSSNKISLIGKTAKSGFETSYASVGIANYVFAEAIDVNGRSLGNSTIKATVKFDNSRVSDAIRKGYSPAGGSFVNGHRFAVLSGFLVMVFVPIQFAIVVVIKCHSRREDIKYTKLDQS